MKVLIIEDEKLAAARLKSILEKIDQEIEVIGEIDTVRESVDFLSKNQKIDLIFCDIHLADGISFEIFEQVEVTIPIIFVTAYDEYSIKAFKVNSIDYLLKPINEKAVAEALEKHQKISKPAVDVETLKNLENLISNSQRGEKRFLVKSGIKLVPKKESDLALIFVNNKISHLIDGNNQKVYLIEKTLEELINIELDPTLFFRINRKQIVGKEFIESIKPHYNQRLSLELKIPVDQELIVSREKVNEFKKWFIS